VRRIVGTVAAALLLTTASACSDDALKDPAGPNKEVTLTVFAAASLKDSFTEIGKKFEADNPGVTVRFNFAGSSDLVAQIQQGAPADVFASADTKTMDQARAAGVLDGSAHEFASNTLEIATPPGNPAHIDSLADLADPDAKAVLCAPEVPCGAAAAAVEKVAGVTIKPVSEEQSVTDVLGKVISGEADAGLVYVTDVNGAGASVHGVTFAASAKIVNTYPIAALKHRRAEDGLAEEFIDYVTGAKGQAALAAAGFGKP
jgi:molybdate transport system substrate-binding protein